MLGFVIQRLLQAFIVMLVISLLVFCGVYAVGNPIDVLLSPDATQQIREQTVICARYYRRHDNLRIQRMTGIGGALRFCATDIRRAMRDLSLQIRELHRVVIDDHDLADTRCRKIKTNRKPNSKPFK